MDMDNKELIHFIIPSIAILLSGMYFIGEADAIQTVVINPVRESIDEETGTLLLGSRIPGCQDPVIVNGTVIREAGCFTPNDIAVKPGTLIIFKNNDVSAHSFTSEKFNSQLMINDGSEFNWIADEVGKIKYSCLLHPWTVGTINVVSAPTLSGFHQVPEWVNNLFDWYNSDIIDYEAFMNALIYLMSNNIITDIDTDITIETSGSTQTPIISTVTQEEYDALQKKCEDVYSSFSRKKLGCDLPITTTTTKELTTLEEKCLDVYSSYSRKKLGCDEPQATTEAKELTDLEIRCLDIYSAQSRTKAGCDAPPAPTNGTATVDPKTALEIRCEGVDTKKQRLALGCEPRKF